jgi:hypothetical protein
MKSNGAFKRIKNNPPDKDGPILSDILIPLTGSKTKKRYPKPLRKVRSYDKAYHHPYECITNNREMTAQDISDFTFTKISDKMPSWVGEY